MKTYTRKPIKVEAIQWTGDNIQDFTSILPVESFMYHEGSGINMTLIYKNDSGSSKYTFGIPLGGWVILDQAKDFPVVEEMQFKEEYEEVETKEENLANRFKEAAKRISNTGFKLKK